MRAVKREILANQRTPPSTQYSDLLAKQSRAIGGACRQESGNEKKHVRAWQTSHETKNGYTFSATALYRGVFFVFGEY